MHAFMTAGTHFTPTAAKHGQAVPMQPRVNGVLGRPVWVRRALRVLMISCTVYCGECKWRLAEMIRF